MNRAINFTHLRKWEIPDLDVLHMVQIFKLQFFLKVCFRSPFNFYDKA